jgi:hypothetical protein
LFGDCLENWHSVPEFKETNEFLERNGVKGETRKMTSKRFLKALLARLKVRNSFVPNQQCSLPAKVFEAMIKDVVASIVKTKNKPLLDYVGPVVKKLVEKKVSELDAVDHTCREAIKLMSTTGLISGPGEYVVIFSWS